MNPSARTLLIVDDEAPARDRLERLVAELPEWKVVGTAASGQAALESVQRERPSVVLLDIRMPGMSGLEVARHLARLQVAPAVIFITAFDEYALEAFDAHAVAYLLKPVRLERLAAALTRAGRINDALLAELSRNARSPSQRQYIPVRDRDRLRLIPVASIRYFEAGQKYVSVYHSEGVELIEESLRQLELEFPDRFVRIHRSMLVAVAAIEALEKDAAGGHHVRLRGDELSLPVSRRQLTELKARLAAGR